MFGTFDPVMSRDCLRQSLGHTRRIGKPEEVASLAAWLASDGAAYVTGQCIVMSGGL